MLSHVAGGGRGAGRAELRRKMGAGAWAPAAPTRVRQKPKSQKLPFGSMRKFKTKGLTSSASKRSHVGHLEIKCFTTLVKPILFIE